MSEYCHTTHYSLRYSDFDFKDELLPVSLLALVQESACRSADELGFGYHDLRPLHYGFLVVNTYCEFVRPIRLGDDIVVKTWPLPPRHVICERDYLVETAKGEKLAALASRWCLVDLESFSLLTPDKMEAHARCPYRNEHTVAVPSWKIPRIAEGREAYRMKVRTGHCDHYFHANNTRYADFFFDCFSSEELSARPVRAFQIAYSKQAKEGKELIFVREDRGDVSLCEAYADGELLSQFCVFFGGKS